MRLNISGVRGKTVGGGQITSIKRRPASELAEWNRIVFGDGAAFPNRAAGGGIVGEDALGAGGGGGHIDLGQPAAVFGKEGGGGGPGGEVGPLVRVIAEIVEFFAAVGVADVAVVFAADAVVALIVGGDRGAFARGGGVAELGDET